MFHVSGEPGCFLSDLRHERHVFCPANSDPPPLLENIRSCQVIQDFLFMSRAGVNTGGGEGDRNAEIEKNYHHMERF